MCKIAYRAFLLLLLLKATTPLVAFYNIFSSCDNTIEFRSAAFFLSSERFQNVYGTIGIDYQIEVSTPLKECVVGWTNGAWISKQGRADACNDRTKIDIVNISLGIKVPYQLNDYFTVYLGIGPSFSNVWINANSQCNGDFDSRLAIGGVLKSGINCSLTPCVFIDLFADYVYQPVRFRKGWRDVGGLKTGAGVGIKFGL